MMSTPASVEGDAKDAKDAKGFHRLLSQVESLLLRVNAIFLFLGMTALVFFCFAQAADRYTLKSRFDAHDQLAKVGLVWVVFCGMAIAYAAKENLRIDLLFNKLPMRVRLVRDAAYEVVILALCILLNWKGWAVIDVASYQQIMGTPFTNALPYSALLLSTASIAATCSLRLAGLSTSPPGDGS